MLIKQWLRVALNWQAPSSSACPFAVTLELTSLGEDFFWNDCIWNQLKSSMWEKMDEMFSVQHIWFMTTFLVIVIHTDHSI